MRLDTSKLDMTQGGVQPGDSYPKHGRGCTARDDVFYSAFAHAPATWDNPQIQEMYLGAIKWALGVVDADVTPDPIATPTSTPAAK